MRIFRFRYNSISRSSGSQKDTEMAAASTNFEMSSDLVSQLNALPANAVKPKVESLLSVDEIPVWLNKDFIQNILQNHQGNNGLRVKSLAIQQCGGKGDSYASMMYRIGTNYFDIKTPQNVQTRSLIAKTLPEQEMALEKLGADNYNVQNKEMEMYQKVLPEFSRVLETIDEGGDIFPRVLAVDKSLDVILLEDLVEKEFVMANRLTGLDLNHTLMALRKLARMHAASAFMYARDPSAFARLDAGFFTRKTDVFHVMFESLCEAMMEEVATWDGFEHYAKKLVKVRESLVVNAQRAFDCDEGDFHVLTHGDLWTNNLMYKYDEAGAPIDCVLLDFQFASIGSPALDLIYFLFTSTTDDLRQERMEELMQYYYYELKDLLLRLGYDMGKFPTLHGFQMQVHKKYFYAFTSALVIFPVMISQDKDADFESLMSRDERALGFKKRIYKNPIYQMIAKKIIPMLDRKGILDDM